MKYFNSFIQKIFFFFLFWLLRQGDFNHYLVMVEERKINILFYFYINFIIILEVCENEFNFNEFQKGKDKILS